MKTYSVSKGKSVNVITSASLGAFSLILVVNIWLLTLSKSLGEGAANILLIVAILAAIIVSFIYSVKGYEVTADSISVIRPLNKMVIPRNEITNVRPLGDDETQGLRRQNGIGGLFSYTGIFNSDKLGQVRLYITRKDKCVFIETRTQGNFILSPDDENFIKDIWS
jgi:hypothetical protein